MSYAYAKALAGSDANVFANSGFGPVNGWCTAVHPPFSVGSNIGASTTHRNSHAPSAIKLQRLPISRRTAPRSERDDERSPAAKKIASPGFAPAAATIPAVSFSEIFFETGPPRVPSSFTRMYARPFAPRAFAQSCQASSSRRGDDAPPGITTLPT